jgi:hypothetical protein
LVIDSADRHIDASTAIAPPTLSSSALNSIIYSKRARVTLLGVIIAAIAITLPIVFSQDPEMQLALRNLSIVVLAAIAAGSSIFAAVKMKDRSYKVMLALFALGIGLWSAAEAVWNYYVYVLYVEVPYPSIADIFYLAAYPFVGYFLYRGNKMLGERRQEEDKLIATAITITIVAFIFNIFLVQIIESSIGFSGLSVDDITLLLLSVAYPILDAILLVPAVMILYSALQNRSQSLTWTLLAASMLVTVVADTGFGYTALVGLENLETEAIWDLLYTYLYILVTGAMVHEILARKDRAAVKAC